MVDYNRILFFPTISAKIIFSILNKPEEHILEMRCRRHHLVVESNTDIDNSLSFVKKNVATMIGYTVDFKQQFSPRCLRCSPRDPRILKNREVFPFKEFVKFMQKNKLTDLPIRKLVLLNKNPQVFDKLADELKYKGKLKQSDKVVILVFSAKNQIRCPEALRKKIYEFSEDAEILKLSTLDLKAIYLYPDWKLQIHENLIPPFNQDTKMLKLVVKDLFVKGKRDIIQYQRGTEKVWTFKDILEF